MAILDENGVINWATDIKVLSDATYERKPLKFTNIVVPTNAFDSNRQVSELSITLNNEIEDSQYIVFDNNEFKAMIDSLNLSDGTYSFKYVTEPGGHKFFYIDPGNILTNEILYSTSLGKYILSDWGISITKSNFTFDENLTYFYISYLNPERFSDYSDFPCRATISLSGVTVDMISEVIFGLTEILEGIFAPICESFNGGIYLYSSEIPENNITIPTIMCWRTNT